MTKRIKLICDKCGVVREVNANEFGGWDGPYNCRIVHNNDGDFTTCYGDLKEDEEEYKDEYFRGELLD